MNSRQTTHDTNKQQSSNKEIIDEDYDLQPKFSSKIRYNFLQL